MKEIIRRADEKGLRVNDKPIDKEYIILVINGKATDELHKIMKSGYRRKIAPNKREKDNTFYK